MKIINIFRVVVLITLSLFFPLKSTSNLYIQCPAGYVQFQDDISINVNGNICLFRTILCVKCDASPISQSIELHLIAFYPVGNCNITNIKLVKDLLELKVTSPHYIDEKIRPNCFAGWGPCEWNSIELKGVSPICWKKIAFNYDPNDPTKIKIAVVACYDYNCECIDKWSVCYENNEFKKRHYDGYPKINPFAQCQCNVRSPIPDDPTEEGETMCFYLESACYPVP